MGRLCNVSRASFFGAAQSRHCARHYFHDNNNRNVFFCVWDMRAPGHHGPDGHMFRGASFFAGTLLGTWNTFSVHAAHGRNVPRDGDDCDTAVADSVRHRHTKQRRYYYRCRCC